MVPNPADPPRMTDWDIARLWDWYASPHAATLEPSVREGFGWLLHEAGAARKAEADLRKQLAEIEEAHQGLSVEEWVALSEIYPRPKD